MKRGNVSNYMGINSGSQLFDSYDIVEYIWQFIVCIEFVMRTACLQLGVLYAFEEYEDVTF